MELFARESALVKSELINDAMQSPEALHSAAQALDTPRNQGFLDEYERRLKMSHASLLVGNLLFASALCAILLFFGVFHGRGIGTTAVVYLVGFNYLMASLRTLGKSMTVISIYHPAFGRYVDFMRTGSLSALRLKEEITTETDDALLEEELAAE